MIDLPPLLNARLKSVRKSMRKHNIDSLLVSSPSNLTYLTGIYPFSQHHREAYLLVTQVKTILIISPLRLDSFKDQVNSFELVSLSSFSFLKETLKPFLSETLFIEPNNFTAAEAQGVKNSLGLKTAFAPKLIEIQRTIKDKYEQAQLKKAGILTSKIWKAIRPKIKSGTTELEIQHQIISLIYKLGGSGFPAGFDPIVATGKNSAIPHHVPTRTRIKKDDVVLVDFGITINGYASDMTRTIKLGSKNDKFILVEKIVKKAYQTGLSCTLQHKTSDKIDQDVHSFLQSSPYANKMPHSTGHGVGLDIHEAPSISRKSRSQKIKPGMVIAIEPGIYLKNEFGYRHENTILVEKEKVVELTVLR